MDNIAPGRDGLNSARVIAGPFTRIEREADGSGWLVIVSNGHGWLCGDRRHALREKRWQDRQWGRP
jgi:hypothetical protein